MPASTPPASSMRPGPPGQPNPASSRAAVMPPARSLSVPDKGSRPNPGRDARATTNAGLDWRDVAGLANRQTRLGSAMTTTRSRDPLSRKLSNLTARFWLLRNAALDFQSAGAAACGWVLRRRQTSTNLAACLLSRQSRVRRGGPHGSLPALVPVALERSTAKLSSSSQAESCSDPRRAPSRSR